MADIEQQAHIAELTALRRNSRARSAQRSALDAAIAALASQGEQQIAPDAESAARAYERERDAGATHEQALHSALMDALASQPQAPAAAVPEDVRRDAERWRYLKEECTHHYGDGHSEPREAHLCLEWGQGPWIRDGSNDGRGRPDTFPGWDAIVDEMIARAADELVDLDDDIAAAPAPEVSNA